MRMLAIDCATEACSVALFDGPRLLAGDCQVLGRGHAEALIPMIAALPDRGRADRIGVALGPGSFTGIRVGLAAARALSLAWDVPVAGYATPALIAAMARDQAGARPVSVVTTGGHGEWFVASFAADGAATGPVVSLAPDAAVAAATADLVAGSQAGALVARRGYGTALPILPDARCVAQLGPSAWQDALVPLYGRAPDARLPGQPA